MKKIKRLLDLGGLIMKKKFQLNFIGTFDNIALIQELFKMLLIQFHYNVTPDTMFKLTFTLNFIHKLSK